jgi:2-polyprenyl-3-methyl-5-hydroxy-6-metoxy-1,4-benzoquinol methylase
MVRKANCKTILDYGCGKGTLKPAMAKIAPELTVLEYDPAIEGKDALPTEPVDFVACLDVMEHIELEYLEGVLSTIRGLNPKRILMVIATRPAIKTLPDGRNAHLIVQPAAWWLNRLEPYFTAIGRHESSERLVFVGTPKREIAKE